MYLILHMRRWPLCKRYLARELSEVQSDGTRMATLTSGRVVRIPAANLAGFESYTDMEKFRERIKELQRSG